MSIKWGLPQRVVVTKPSYTAASPTSTYPRYNTASKSVLHHTKFKATVIWSMQSITWQSTLGVIWSRFSPINSGLGKKCCGEQGLNGRSRQGVNLRNCFKHFVSRVHKKDKVIWKIIERLIDISVSEFIRECDCGQIRRRWTYWSIFYSSVELKRALLGTLSKTEKEGLASNFFMCLVSLSYVGSSITLGCLIKLCPEYKIK